MCPHNLENLYAFTIDDGMQSCCHIYQISALVFYKCNNLMQQTKSFLNKDYSYITNGLFGCFIHLKQPHSNMHGHLSVIQKLDS
jgi:hypothetical protein